MYIYTSAHLRISTSVTAALLSKVFERRPALIWGFTDLHHLTPALVIV